MGTEPEVSGAASHRETWLPAALRARVVAIPDAEERIRTIVEHVMSTKGRVEKDS
jgi:hypothetical protein